MRFARQPPVGWQAGSDWCILPPMIHGLLIALTMSLAVREDAEPLPASDWITTGTDCHVFAAGDVDGDGWADFLTINGNRELCMARSVNGWKAAGWEVIAKDVSPDAVGMGVMSLGSGGGSEPGLASRQGVVVVEKGRLVVLGGYANRDFAERRELPAPEGITLKSLEERHDGVIVIVDEHGKRWRVEGEQLLVENDEPALGSNGVPPQTERKGSLPGEARVRLPAGPPYDQEATLLARLNSEFGPGGGRLAWSVFATRKPSRHHVVRYAVTESPDKEDADLDGLRDADEARLGTDPHNRDTDGDGLLDGWEVHGLPRDFDLGPRIGLYDPSANTEEREKQLSPLRQDVIVAVSYYPGVDAAKFQDHVPRIDGLYRATGTRNPDGSTGIRIHFIELGTVDEADVGRHWGQNGAKYRPAAWRGLVHWMQVTPGGGGQASQTGDMGSCGNGWAVFAHELGHQLSLSHSGDSSPGLCPLYTSLMSYAYNYSFDGDGGRIHFSQGALRGVELDERRLVETLPFPFEQVKFLANHPFRFTLKDNGDGTTLIDWNHNGVFDEGPIEADINYGYSTHAGDRKTHELVGSAPSIAYIGGTAVLAASDHKHTAVTVKAYHGEMKWSAPISVPGSPTTLDPVLAGGEDYGLLFFRRQTEWRVGKVTVSSGAPTVEAVHALPGLPLAELSAMRVGEHWLLVTRYDDNRLEARWLSLGEKPDLSEPMELAATSQVPVALAMNPADGTITMVGAVHHEKAGPFTLQIVPMKREGDVLSAGEPFFTHNGNGNHCTSRPVAAYRGEGPAAQLTIFHTAWPAENGTWVGVRTMQVGNKALNGGWLTTQMYDEWTRSRVALGFADGPQGAIYAFRWDPGDHGEWKVNTLFVAHEGWGIDDQPMRDFDDAAQMSQWGIRHSKLTMQP